jgi:hypothetical protein
VEADWEVTTPMIKTAKKKKTKAPRDPDHRAAWLACRKPWIEDWPFLDEPRIIDLRAALDDLLKSRWSIQALKAFAYCECQLQSDRYDHVTDGAWRLAVSLAAEGRASCGGDFRLKFNANPENYSFVK